MYNYETGRYASSSEGTLTILTHGSHLYGTSSGTSDHDFKIIYLPDLKRLLLTYRPKTTKERHDKDHNKVDDNATMPDGGAEAEIIPLQSFINDYLCGRAYAMEIVYAQLQRAWYIHKPDSGRSQWVTFHKLCEMLHEQFRHQNITEMLGFASKQTMDYVHRGRRLAAAEGVLAVVNQLREEIEKVHGKTKTVKLNSIFQDKPVYQIISERAGLPIGSTTNNDVTRPTLVLNKRDYLDTMSLNNFRESVISLVETYGERVKKVLNNEVEWKSMYHAIRTYEQIIEYLETEWITYPRPNVQELLDIKNGIVPFEEVKAKFTAYDIKVKELLANSKLPQADQEFRKKVEDAVMPIIMQLYQRQLEAS